MLPYIEPQKQPIIKDAGTPNSAIVRLIIPSPQRPTSWRLLHSTPERAIAEQIGVDHKTIAKARKRTEDLSPVAKRPGRDGERHKLPQPNRSEPSPSRNALPIRYFGLAADQRRATNTLGYGASVGITLRNTYVIEIPL
jgi:hypothetical protein